MRLSRNSSGPGGAGTLPATDAVSFAAGTSTALVPGTGTAIWRDRGADAGDAGALAIDGATPLAVGGDGTATVVCGPLPPSFGAAALACGSAPLSGGGKTLDIV